MKNCEEPVMKLLFISEQLKYVKLFIQNDGNKIAIFTITYY